MHSRTSPPTRTTILRTSNQAERIYATSSRPPWCRQPIRHPTPDPHRRDRGLSRISTCGTAGYSSLTSLGVVNVGPPRGSTRAGPGRPPGWYEGRLCRGLESAAVPNCWRWSGRRWSVSNSIAPGSLGVQENRERWSRFESDVWLYKPNSLEPMSRAPLADADEHPPHHVTGADHPIVRRERRDPLEARLRAQGKVGWGSTVAGTCLHTG
jgi:hypothetical protein